MSRKNSYTKKDINLFYERILIAAAIFFGIIIRAEAFHSSFPVNDGGMFYTMMQDIIANGCCSLPHYTSYNNLSIPFTYPPVGFLIGIATSKIFSIELYSVLIFVPFIFSIGSIFVSYLFLKKIVSSNVAIFATLLFAITPRTYLWQIMGGGITRSAGMFFGILCLFLSAQFLQKNYKMTFVGAATSLAFCITSHLEWGFFTVTTLIIFAFFMNSIKHKKKVVISIIVSGFILSLLWFVPVFIIQGTLTPFISFASVGFSKFNRSVLVLSIGYITQENFFPLVGITGILGFFLQAKKNVWLAIWGFVPLLINPRTSFNYIAIPLTISASYVLTQLFIQDKKTTHYAFVTIMGISLMYIFAIKLNLDSDIKANTWPSLSFSDITAMKWVEAHTMPMDQFLVLPEEPDLAWSVSPVTEWFPTIAKRHSIITAQGSEWLPEHEFNKRINYYVDTQKCFYKTIDCYENIAEKYGFSYNYIYVPKQKREIIIQSLKESPSYTQRYDSDDVRIYKRQ